MKRLIAILMGVMFIAACDPSQEPISTPDALARSNRVTVPSGSSQYENDPTSGGNDRTYDARSSVHTTTCAADETPFTVGKNSAPFRLAWIGGRVNGGVPDSHSWQQTKDQCDVPTLRIAGREWIVIDGLRARDIEDGVDPRGPDGAPNNGGDTVLRNAYFLDIRDDCVENDNWQQMVVWDSLLDSCYTGFSEQASSGITTPPADERFEVHHTLMHLAALHAPRECPVGSPVRGHGKPFKWETNSHRVDVSHSVFWIEERPNDNCSASDSIFFPPGDYEDVTVVWTGGGAFPGNVPPGVSVTTNLNIWTLARQEWLNRHGCSSFDNCTKLFNPDPL